jgi:hypothetical protein
MGDQPGADELLTVARETLKQVLDELPPERRYPVLMVLNAMAIAARDGLAPSDVEAQRQLQQICGGEPAPCEVLYARLVRDIRAGRFDGDTRLGQWLQEDVRRRLARSNPQYLRMAENAVRIKKPPPGSPDGGSGSVSSRNNA